MGEFKPCTGKGFGEILGVVAEFFGNDTVGGIHFHGHISIGHDWVVAYGGVFDIGSFIVCFDINGFPLACAGGAFLEFPFVFKEEIEVATIPLVGFVVQAPSIPLVTVSRPTPGRVIHPTHTLFVQIGTFGCWA